MYNPLAMNALADRFVEALGKDSQMWDEAAQACESVAPPLVDDDQKRQWRTRAESYRAQARSHRALIGQVKESTGLH
jgi:hypothetical protein